LIRAPYKKILKANLSIFATILENVNKYRSGSKLFPDSNLFTLSNLSLLTQILVFLLVLYGVQMTKESIVKHGKLSGTAFYLALPSVIYMLYSRARGLTLPYYDSLLGPSHTPWNSVNSPWNSLCYQQVEMER